MTAPEALRTRAARVLLVDDRPDNLLTLEAVLEPLRFELMSATSGPDALRCLLEGDVAAIVLDVQMPDMDGFETASLLKSRAATRHIPIVLLTAISHDLAHQLRGYDAGAIDYISKPFDPNVLRAKVRALVELSADLHTHAGARASSPSAVRPSGEPGFARQGDDLRTAPSWAVAGAQAKELVPADFELATRVVEVGLDADIAGPAAARRAVQGALRGHPAALLDAAVLLVSELVTNSVVHARSACTLRLDLGTSLVRVEVADEGRVIRGPRASRPLDGAGRGLQLVQQLSDRCGSTRTVAGKIVWFELDLGREEP